MADDVKRRDFLRAVGAATLSAAGDGKAPQATETKEPPKGKIPDKPLKFGHMTFFTGPSAVLGEQSYKGHILTAEELNAQSARHYSASPWLRKRTALDRAARLLPDASTSPDQQRTV